MGDTIHRSAEGTQKDLKKEKRQKEEKQQNEQ